MRAVIGGLVAVAMMCAHGVALADAEQDATARALFVSARALMKDGAWEEARQKLEQAYALSPGKGILFNLAVCLENTGKIASAWERYLEVVSAEHRAGDDDRAEIARARADAIAARVPHVRIHVSKTVENATVTRDGTALSAAAWDTPLPVDPGEHVIAVAAEGRVTWSTRFSVTEGETHEVEAPELARIERPVVVVARHEQLVSRRSTTWRTAGATGMITGVVSLAAAGITTGLAVAWWNEGTPYCTNGCLQHGFDLRSQSITAGDFATGFFVGGTVLAIGGALVYFLAPRTQQRVTIGAGGVRASF